MNIPIATYEIASNPCTKRKGDFLYYQGKKYRCPELTGEILNVIVKEIEEALELKPKKKLFKDWLIPS